MNAKPRPDVAGYAPQRSQSLTRSTILFGVLATVLTGCPAEAVMVAPEDLGPPQPAPEIASTEFLETIVPSACGDLGETCVDEAGRQMAQGATPRDAIRTMCRVASHPAYYRGVLPAEVACYEAGARGLRDAQLVSLVGKCKAANADAPQQGLCVRGGLEQLVGG